MSRIRCLHRLTEGIEPTPAHNQEAPPTTTPRDQLRSSGNDNISNNIINNNNNDNNNNDNNNDTYMLFQTRESSDHKKFRGDASEESGRSIQAREYKSAYGE